MPNNQNVCLACLGIVSSCQSAVLCLAITCITVMDKVELRDIGKRFYDIKIKNIYVFIINIYSSLKLNCALNITINRC